MELLRSVLSSWASHHANSGHSRFTSLMKVRLRRRLSLPQLKCQLGEHVGEQMCVWIHMSYNSLF